MSQKLKRGQVAIAGCYITDMATALPSQGCHLEKNKDDGTDPRLRQRISLMERALRGLAWDSACLVLSAQLAHCSTFSPHPASPGGSWLLWGVKDGA